MPQVECFSNSIGNVDLKPSDIDKDITVQERLLSIEEEDQRL